MGAHLVRGDDPILRADVLDALIGELLGGDDRSLALEDLAVPGRGGDGEAGGADAREAVVAAAVNAAQSPPFMTGVRIVVLRDVGHLLAAEVAPLVRYLVAPLESTELVVVTGGPRVPEALTKALKGAGAVEHGAVRVGAEEVLDAALERAALSLRPDARRTVLERVGTEVGRIPALVEVLAAAFPPATGDGRDRLSAADVEPYLGDEGGVPPWELTKAIEQGDVAGALAVLHRLLHASGPQQPKPMHPLPVLAMLHNHYRRVARLDDPAIATKADAVAALGPKVRDFQAQKALGQARALGTDGIREAYAALAQADLDLKGARAIPEDLVMEVLVARLAALTGRTGRAGGGRRGSAGAGGSSGRRPPRGDSRARSRAGG
ncbi:MAG: hypothetical protein AMXMBFR46_07430 [Acidimicrobiia bacterium]